MVKNAVHHHKNVVVHSIFCIFCAQRDTDRQAEMGPIAGKAGEAGSEGFYQGFGDCWEILPGALSCALWQKP